MRHPRILAIVLAGGQGSRLDVLTRERAKPALPVAGIHRLIDVPLTNLQYSDLQDVIISAQYYTSTLAEVVADGRPYDLDRTRGGLRIEGPQEGRSVERSGFSRNGFCARRAMAFGKPGWKSARMWNGARWWQPLRRSRFAPRLEAFCAGFCRMERRSSAA